ncbi:MAG: FAD-dependent oxidoreductase [Pseudomonadota bacterium]
MSATTAIYARDAAPPVGSEADIPARADVVVVGGGLTGVSAALHLNRDGFGVVLLEQGEIGDGASGRNGGQLHPGQRRDQRWLEASLGRPMARALWRLGEEAVALVHDLRKELGADCDWRPGLIHAAHTARAFQEAREDAEHLSRHYGVTQNVMTAQTLAAAIGTERYEGGVLDPKGGHLNPLALVAAMAERAQVEGTRLLSGARVTTCRRTASGWAVHVSRGGKRAMIRAGSVVLAGNGYMHGISPYLEHRVMPLKNYIVATSPLDAPLIPGGEAVADSRFVIRYFREDFKGRLIFGGGESFGRGPQDIARFVRPYLEEVYPKLAHKRLSAAWDGTLGITRLRLPIIRRIEPDLYVGAGYSGQGLALATFAGKVIADAVGAETSRLDVFGQLPAPPFPGGRALQTPLAQLAMAVFALRDRVGT